MAGPTYYKHVDTTTAVDADAWPDSGLKDADGNELYTFVGDTDDSTNGASADWAVSTPATTPESDTTVTTPTVDTSSVANSQPADVVPDDQQLVTPTTPVANDSDAVGGPAVVTEAPEVDDDTTPVPFDGTTSTEDRVEADAATEAAQVDNAADTAALAAAQAAEDNRFRNENPDAPVVRAANPNIGGESFRA